VVPRAEFCKYVKAEWKFKYNVTVRTTNFAVEKQQKLHIASVC